MPSARLLSLLVLAAALPLGSSDVHATRFAYSADGPILSVIDNANPSSVARVALGASANGVLARDPDDTSLYVATSDYIAVVDTISRTITAKVAVTGVSYLAFSPPAGALYAVGILSIAGAPPAPLIAVVDTRSRRVTASVPLPAPAGSIRAVAVPNSNRIYIVHAPPGCCASGVTVFDTAANAITAEIALTLPGAIAAGSDGRYVYVGTAGGLAVIDVANSVLLQTIPMPPSAIGTPTAIAAIAVDAAGTVAYVGNYALGSGFGGTEGKVLAVDTRTGSIAATIPLDGVPNAMAMHPSASRLYVSGFVPRVSARPTGFVPAGVAVIDTVRLAVIATIPPGSTSPYGTYTGFLAMDPTGAALYAMDGSVVSVIDPAGNGVRATLPSSMGALFGSDRPALPGALYQQTLISPTASTADQWGAPGDRAFPADYDGDGRADLAVFRPREGGEEALWWIRRSGDGGVVRRQWGSVALGDVPVPADYDGDGRTDLAVWRPAQGDWLVLRSSDGQAASWRFGHGTDVPVPADYDGDGRADLATYFQGTWLVYGSRSGNVTLQLGGGTDIPVPADYDGDGRADIAVWSPDTGVWQILQSGTQTIRTVQWGAPGDVPVPADYDGDGKADVAVWRPANGTWWILGSKTGEVSSRAWGAAGDRPTPADFNGDRKADPSIYRP